MTNATRSGDSTHSYQTASTAPSSTAENNGEERSLTSTCSAVEEKKKELVVVPGSGRAGEALQVALVSTGRRQRRRPKEEPWVPPPQEQRPMTPTATHTSYSCHNEPNSPPWVPTLARSQSTPASPRDIVSESRNAWRVTSTSNVNGTPDKKVDGPSLWERNPGGDWGILEATSPASSLSSNPFPTSWAYYNNNNNAQDIFRTPPPREQRLPCDCERCRLYQNLMQRETVCIVQNMSSSMSTLTPDEFLVMECQCSKCYAAQQQLAPDTQPLDSLILVHKSPSTDDSMSTLTPDVVDRPHTGTQHLEKASKGRRLMEAVGILLDVFAPNCCAFKPSKPGVLQPWHLLLPTEKPQSSASSAVHHNHDNTSVLRLRGCYL